VRPAYFPTRWDYPRVGGGTRHTYRQRVAGIGLSPRGRGNLRSGQHQDHSPRTIPAWAGEPWPREAREGSGGDYPRVGGGTRQGFKRLIITEGLSPRGRGNLVAVSLLSSSSRTIPAWAGEPWPREAREGSGGDYPRVGGGTVYGERVRSTASGLSPRGRGNLFHNEIFTRSPGTIPAWAGEPLRPKHTRLDVTDYPRVGGGTSPLITQLAAPMGLSPRGRGNPMPQIGKIINLRTIPAWAGEPHTILWCGFLRRDYPRVGGGTGHGRSFLCVSSGLSPRGRGNRVDMDAVIDEPGTIPAWAGEPSGCGRATHRKTDYPRVGGGTSQAFPFRAQSSGLSPRGRGNLVNPRLVDPGRGTIPAWAGEPSTNQANPLLSQDYPRVGGGTPG